MLHRSSATPDFFSTMNRHRSISRLSHRFRIGLAARQPEVPSITAARRLP
jgi:hypothetical protein